MGDHRGHTRCTGIGMRVEVVVMIETNLKKGVRKRVQGGYKEGTKRVQGGYKEGTRRVTYIILATLSIDFAGLGSLPGFGDLSVTSEGTQGQQTHTEDKPKILY